MKMEAASLFLSSLHQSEESVFEELTVRRVTDYI